MIQNECSTFCEVLAVSSRRKQQEIVQFGHLTYYQLSIPTISRMSLASYQRIRKTKTASVMASEKTNKQNAHEP